MYEEQHMGLKSPEDFDEEAEEIAEVSNREVECLRHQMEPHGKLSEVFDT